MQILELKMKLLLCMYKTKITDSLSKNLTNNVHVLITPLVT